MQSLSVVKFRRNARGPSVIVCRPVFKQLEKNSTMGSTRRNLVRHGTAMMATGALAFSRLFVPTRARAQGTAALPMPDVKAFVFDTFGNIVDWRSGVAREAERILKPMGDELDWLTFADAWRAEYRPSMEIGIGWHVVTF
jgi:hypothetical protein